MQGAEGQRNDCEGLQAARGVGNLTVCTPFRRGRQGLAERDHARCSLLVPLAPGLLRCFTYLVQPCPPPPPSHQVRLAERYERHWGRAAHASLCVTRAMQRELAAHWRVPAAVFYDRPPDFFRPASLQAGGLPSPCRLWSALQAVVAAR